MHSSECLRYCARSAGTGRPRAVNRDVLWRCAIWREWGCCTTDENARTDRAARGAGGLYVRPEWTMVATVGPLAFGVLLIYSGHLLGSARSRRRAVPHINVSIVGFTDWGAQSKISYTARWARRSKAKATPGWKMTVSSFGRREL